MFIRKYHWRVCAKVWNTTTSNQNAQRMAAPEDKQRAKGSEQRRSTACQQEQYGANNLRRITQKKQHAKSVRVCGYLVLDQDTLPYRASTKTVCWYQKFCLLLQRYQSVSHTPPGGP